MEAILMQFREGKEEALKRIYSMFATNLLFTARGIVKNEQEAEDIVLDAFSKCWLKRECFETLYKIKCYLYVVIKHACFHYVDKLKTKASSHREIFYISEEADGFVLEHMIKAEMVERIHKEINLLPERARTMLNWLYVDGLSNTQIAQKMQIPVEHVRVNKSRALNQLRQALSGKLA
ncbi:hypothetical protein GCM10011379_19120 [Filimonas zeae]|uniref:RNA polymerase sigma-70 factor, ECF subfamily n=2 Tax=Filimonas zeae TaxID=1737353 RepID=A0A917IYP0_9BACT|nr:hypothetical protein GCM10011379_19120 [Filimonas zeae]